MSLASEKDNTVAPQALQSLSKTGNGNTVRPKSGSQPHLEDTVDDDSSDGTEDYDDLRLDPNTMVANTRGSVDDGYVQNWHATDALDETAKRREPAIVNPERRTSIQVRLEKTDFKGRYILTADDPEIKEILRKGIERQEEQAGAKKSRVRFRDLVFTRQFTTFDRQNPSAAESPFFGFFILFWLAMALLFVQFSMHNYRDYGNILGTNQVMKLMFSRDVLILGLTDGVMCAATAQGLLFQRLVHKGWLHWERGGWVLQNVSKPMGKRVTRYTW